MHGILCLWIYGQGDTYLLVRGAWFTFYADNHV